MAPDFETCTTGTMNLVHEQQQKIEQQAERIASLESLTQRLRTALREQRKIIIKCKRYVKKVEDSMPW